MKKQTQKCELQICGNYNEGQCMLKEIEINKRGNCTNLWIGVSIEEAVKYMNELQENLTGELVRPKCRFLQN